MKIRKAKPEEAPIIAPLLLLAMEDIIFHFIGENSVEKAIQFLEISIGKNTNQYSYENCWVSELNNEIVAAMCAYDGANLHKLRKPVAETIHSLFNRSFNPEDETQSGEFYLDSLGVKPDRQGEGIGSKLLRFLINEYAHKQNKTLGLLVDKDNVNAKKLYLQAGFKIVGEKTLAGKKMEHLQFKV